MVDCIVEVKNRQIWILSGLVATVVVLNILVFEVIKMGTEKVDLLYECNGCGNKFSDLGDKSSGWSAPGQRPRRPSLVTVSRIGRVLR